MMLENDIIILRAIEPEDADLLYIWENDRSVWLVSHTVAPFSRFTLMDYINGLTDIYTDKQLRLVIQLKADSKAIGTIDLFDCDFKNNKAGIGILIADASERNKGYASISLDLMLLYCFEVLGLHQIYCNVQEDNIASLHLFEKHGFHRVGVKKDWTYHSGIYKDEIFMQKINSDG